MERSVRLRAAPFWHSGRLKGPAPGVCRAAKNTGLIKTIRVQRISRTLRLSPTRPLHMPNITIKPINSAATTTKLRITLAGHHTLKQKRCMVSQIFSWLEYQQGIINAGQIDLYLPCFDAQGRPLSKFPDGTEIAKHTVTIDSPYSAAADEHKA